MEILYVIAMIAVFVLCIALLSTARRILRSSPLASGSLALSRIYDGQHPEEELLEEVPANELELYSVEAESVELTPVIVKPIAVETMIARTIVHESISEETIVAESAFDTSMQPMPPVLEEESASSTVSVPARVNKAVRIRKPSRRAYNYALECLLIGISAWVLIKTQQSTSRYRLPQPSNDRVA